MYVDPCIILILWCIIYYFIIVALGRNSTVGPLGNNLSCVDVQYVLLDKKHI